MPAGYRSVNQRLNAEKITGVDSVFSPISKTLDKMIEVDNRRKDVEDARAFQVERENVKTQNLRADAGTLFGRQKLLNIQKQGFIEETAKNNVGRTNETNDHLSGLKIEENDAKSENDIALQKIKNKGTLGVANIGYNGIVYSTKNKKFAPRYGSGSSSSSSNSGFQNDFKTADFGVLSTKDTQGDSIKEKKPFEEWLNTPNETLRKLVNAKEVSQGITEKVASKIDAIVLKELKTVGKDIPKNRVGTAILSNVTDFIAKVTKNKKDAIAEYKKSNKGSGGLFGGGGLSLAVSAKDLSKISTKFDDQLERLENYKTALNKDIITGQNILELYDKSTATITNKFKIKTETDIPASKINMTNIQANANLLIKESKALRAVGKTKEAKAKEAEATKLMKQSVIIAKAINIWISREQKSRLAKAESIAKAQGEGIKLKLKQDDKIETETRLSKIPSRSKAKGDE